MVHFCLKTFGYEIYERLKPKFQTIPEKSKFMEAKFKKKSSIQLKFSLAVSLLIIFIYLLIGKFVLDHEKKAFTYEAKKRILTQLRALSQTSQKLLLQPEPEFFLSPLIKRIIDENEDILDAVVVDARGKIKGHQDMMKIDTAYEEDENLVTSTDRLLLIGRITSKFSRLISCAPLANAFIGLIINRTKKIDPIIPIKRAIKVIQIILFRVLSRTSLIPSFEKPR